MCPHWGSFNCHAVGAPWAPSSGSGSNSHIVLQIKEKKPKKGGLDGTYPEESGFQVVLILSTHHQSHGGHPGSLLTPTPPQLRSPTSSLTPGYRASPHPRWISTVHVGLARQELATGSGARLLPQKRHLPKGAGTLESCLGQQMTLPLNTLHT